MAGQAVAAAPGLALAQAVAAAPVVARAAAVVAAAVAVAAVVAAAVVAVVVAAVAVVVAATESVVAAVAQVQAPVPVPVPVREQSLPEHRLHPVWALCPLQPPSQQVQALRSRRNPITQWRCWRTTAPWRLGEIGASRSTFQYTTHAVFFHAKVTVQEVCGWQFSVPPARRPLRIRFNETPSN